MLKKFFFGIIIFAFVALVVKVIFIDEKIEPTPETASTTIDNVAKEVGKDTEEVDDDILDVVFKFIEETVDYLKN
ncbi:MAG: hypothetical protein ACK5N8_07280 [Alphaproteobacteria bacterium]